MRTYSFKNPPLKIHGASLNKDGRLVRMDDEVAKTVNEYTGVRIFSGAGVRIRFKTDAKSFTIKAKLESNGIDWAIPLSGSAGMDIFEENERIALVNPKNYGILDVCETVKKSDKMSNITILLPRNEPVIDLEISVDDEYTVLPPDPYTYEKPIVFYGSSITEGGCSSSVSKCYTALVTRWLDSDYINLGVSGNARGETNMANYIKNLDMSIFVLDYDHNAPSVEHLKATHEPFFKIIREKNPTLPIVMMSKPDFDSNVEENTARREIIRQTYENALACGDKNVYFIDGESFFGDTDRSICTVEGCHPTDLGFMRIAEKVYPVLKSILEKNNENL
ncbi:MAG: hypothetical protein IJZ04_05360 [Clostridia bacterium]|nr:hypothetical protein [Clostridia bacterium]